MDWIHALLTYIRILKAVPKLEHIVGVLDLVYPGMSLPISLAR